ncbi:MAG: MFS transporter [Acidimicrobiales bacterium]
MTQTTPATDSSEPVAAPGNALRVRNFRFLWLNNIAFFLVANAERFLFGSLVLDHLDRGESEQALVIGALGLPALFLTLHAGVWADRIDRRKMLMTTQMAGAVVMTCTALLVASGRLTVGWAMLAAAFAGSAAALGSPVRSSLVPALVEKHQLYSAIAVNALAMTASLIFGPVVIRAVQRQVGFAGAFWFQAGLMLLGVVFLVQLRVPHHETVATRRKISAEVRDALSHVWHDNALRTLFGLLIVASLSINPAVMVTMQAHVKTALGREAGDAAIPLAFMGLGIAISSVVVMKSGDLPNKGTLFQRAVIVGSSVTFFIGRSTNFGVVCALALLMGLAGGFYINMNQGLIQASTPQALMGRVMALYTLVQAGFMPIGVFVLGNLSEAYGTGAAISGVTAVAFAIFVTVYVRNAELRRLG